MIFFATFCLGTSRVFIFSCILSMNLFLFSFSCENNGEENGKQEFDAVEYPLTTVKAKPTIDRKNYIVVFFPRTKSYSWVDMLLVLPIEECPSPLVNGTHRKWRKLVKDLGVPRRYIMQKLAISMLNLSDELHIEVCCVLTCFFLLFWLHCYC